MKFDPKIHHRRSIRLQGYDYTTAGAYFITIVAYQRECLFGEIQNGEMILSAMGQIADENWRAIPEHFPNAESGTYVVMPNHVHGIIILHDESIVGATHPVGGATQIVVGATHPVVGATKIVVGATQPVVGATHWVAPTKNGPKRGSIGAIIGAYKMAVTRRIQRELNGANIWQRNYYEHIIRNDDEHNRMHVYIESNIDNWANDDENPVKPR